MTYIGFDNGIGTIGILTDGAPPEIHKTPIKKKCRDYTKDEKYISRLDVPKLTALLSQLPLALGSYAAIERPLVNPTRFNASLSAVRIHEAILIVLEDLGIPHEFLDSKSWQKDLLPKDSKGSEELKAASKVVGIRLYPELESNIKTDADGLLIAHYVKKQNKAIEL